MKKNIKLILTSVFMFGLVFAQPTASLTHAATDQESAAAAKQGVEYLKNNQNDDGSVAGFGGETEWAVIAVEASGEKTSNVDNGSGRSMQDFIASDKPREDAPATTIERKILAISASGNDTSDFNGYDYNEKLKTYHVDEQIGDNTLLNDDIFGIIAVKATGDEALKSMAQDGLNYLIKNQGEDGGFSYTTNSCEFCGSDSNDTAAAIIAFDAAEKLALTNPDLNSSKNSAVIYLLSTQNDDGGFGYNIFSPSDGSSTSWALMALNVIGDSVRNHALLARDWLLANQNPDGGFSYGAFGVNSSDTYTSAHASIALLGSSWLLDPAPFASSFSPPSSSGNRAGGGSNGFAYNLAIAPAIPAAATTAGVNNAAPASSAAIISSSPSTLAQATNTNDQSESKVAKVNGGPAQTQNSGQDKGRNSNLVILGAAALAVIGLGYFVIESIKTRRT